MIGGTLMGRGFSNETRGAGLEISTVAVCVRKGAAARQTGKILLTGPLCVSNG